MRAQRTAPAREILRFRSPEGLAPAERIAQDFRSCRMSLDHEVDACCFDYSETWGSSVVDVADRRLAMFATR